MSSKAATDEGRRAAEQAARLAYGRLLASLCQYGATLAQAEDALSEAFVRALDRWATHGVPAAPEAWLLTTARRVLIDQARHASVVENSEADVQGTYEERLSPDTESSDLVPLIEQLEQEGEQLIDRRLALMMLCAHPEIPANARAPLMLQAVLGMTAQTMSAAFLVSPSALGQRLARAKTTIRAKGLPFEVPDRYTRAERLGDVLEAIYAAFSTAYDVVESAKDRRQGLAHEAIWLAQIVTHELEESAEAHGLLSLMLFVQARVNARRKGDAFVPLSDQDRERWNWRLIAIAEHHLGKAAALKQPGRFQIEAAIQSHHVLHEGDGPDWPAVVNLYDALVVHAPTLAAWVGRAAAVGEANGAAAGLEALAHMPADRVRDYQPYWAVKAHLLVQDQSFRDAEHAYSRASALCEDASVRRFLQNKCRQMRSST